MLPAPDLVEDGLRLRLLNATDLDGIERGIRDEEIVRWWGEFQQTPRDLLDKKLREWNEDSLVPLAIIESGQFAGHVFLDLHEDDIAHVAYWLLPDARGRGNATRAVRILARWALDTLDTARIELWIERGNETSRRVAERAGFIYEGTLRSGGLRDGKRFDKELFSLLRADLTD